MSDPRLPAAAADDETLLDDDDLNGVDPDADDEDAEGEGAQEREAVGADDGEADAGDADEDRQGRQTQGQTRDVGRGANRYQRLANENRELKRRQDTLEREIQISRQQQRQPTQAEIAEAQRVEDERLSMMSPGEQARYLRQQISRDLGQELQRDRQALHDRADKTDYDNLLTSDPTLRKFEDKVAELLPQAPGVPRRILLATAIGMAALDNRGRAKTRGQRQGDAARERQRARPSSGGRSDVRSERGRSGTGNADGSFEHMRNVNI